MDAEEEEENKKECTANPLYAKYDEYFETVKKDPEDFQTWTYLLGTAERLDEIDRIIEVFDLFLTEYPLCYGYWKKYADATERHSGLHAAMSQPLDIVRAQFERAVAYVGHDYQSHQLWDKYFQIEIDQADVKNIAALYKRVISIPLKELETYYGKFVNFAAEHEISEMVGEEEIESYLQQMTKAKDNQEEDEETAVNINIKLPESNVDAEGDQMKTESRLRPTDSFSDSEIKTYWLQCMAELYEKTGKELTTRRQFEEYIKRPYFHVKPLDGIQLQTWWKYLDYIIEKGDCSEVTIIFERCLVPCALYPEFWTRYVTYLEKIDLEQAQYALYRATQVFCKKKSDIHLLAARFYERHSDIASARQCLEHVTNNLAPSLLQGIIQLACFECRHQNFEKAHEVYENAIANELEKEESFTVGYLAVQYAYTLITQFGEKDKAREVLDGTLEKRPDLLILWEGSIQIEEMIGDELRTERIRNLYKKSSIDMTKSLSEDDQHVLIQRFLTFLDLFGSQEMYAEAQYLFIHKFGARKLNTYNLKRTSPFQSESSSNKTQRLDNSNTYTSPFANFDVSSSQISTQTNISASQIAQYYTQFAAAAAASGAEMHTGYQSQSG